MQSKDAEWYRSALNAMRDMVLIKGPRSQLLWANKAFLDYYGMTEAQLQDVIDADHSDPDDTLQYVIDDQIVFDTSDHLNIPREVVTDADGNARNFHTIKSPIFEDDKVARSIGVARLSEDTKVISRDMSHQDAKDFVAPLKALTAGFPNPMLMVDVAKRIVTVSPLWRQRFGDVDFTPNTFFEGGYADLPTVNEALDTCLATRDHVQLELTHTTSTGAHCIYAIEIGPWEYADGALGGATIIANDITVLADRTAALERANQELTQFSYRASHDLKGPLSTVKGLATFIQEDIENDQLEEAKKNAGQIQKTMERLENTVISILAISRADLKEEEADTVQLPALLDDILDDLTHDISTHRIAITHDFEVPQMICQPTRLRQVLENLLSNAIKYRTPDMPENTIHISTAPVKAGVEICVKDNGLGIPPGTEKKIFDLFSRYHTEYEGSGLGLAIVKKHVDTLNGTILAKNTAQGTVFQIFIPQQKPEVLV